MQYQPETNAQPHNLLIDAPASLRARAPDAFTRLERLDSLSQVHRVEFEPGRRLVWRRFGEGPPLLLLHGGHGSWLHWARNIEPLSRTHALWLPDLPGAGESDAPTFDAGLPEIADIVIATIDKLLGAQTPLDVAGFSFGGLTCGHIAGQRSNIRRVAMVGPGGHGFGRRQTIPMMNWKTATSLEEEEFMQRNNMRSLLFADEAAIDDDALALHTVSCHAARLRSKKLANRNELPAAMGKVTADTLVIWGEHDVTAVPEVAGPGLVAAAGRARLEWRVVAGVGHMAQYEAARPINEMLEQWFGQTSTTTK